MSKKIYNWSQRLVGDAIGARLSGEVRELSLWLCIEVKKRHIENEIVKKKYYKMPRPAFRGK